MYPYLTELIYWSLLATNAITFAIVGLEKLRWKFYPDDRLNELVSEAFALSMSSLGGALGTVLGMIAFSHWIDKRIFQVALLGTIIVSFSILFRLASF